MTINEIKISYAPTFINEVSITKAKIAAELLMKNWDDISIYESFYVITMNRAHMPTGIRRIGSGGISATIVDCRILFAILLKTLSTGFIVAHNHPSGKLVPSSADKALTDKIKRIAEFHDINFLDHLILSSTGGYYSFSESGAI